MRHVDRLGNGGNGSDWQTTRIFFKKTTVMSKTLKTKPMLVRGANKEAFELETKYLTAFSKTDDPDTRQVALTDLEALVRQLEEKTIGVFLKVFSDVHLERRKPAGKAALMRFLGQAMGLKPDLFAPHFRKFSKLCIKRLGDATDAVRDDAASALATCVLQVCVHPENVATLLPSLVAQLGAMLTESNRAAGGAACALGELVRLLGPSCHPETFLPVWTYLRPALEQPDHVAKPFVMKCVSTLVSILGMFCRTLPSFGATN
jgi:hypothetical protein